MGSFEVLIAQDHKLTWIFWRRVNQDDTVQEKSFENLYLRDLQLKTWTNFRTVLIYTIAWINVLFQSPCPTVNNLIEFGG